MLIDDIFKWEINIEETFRDNSITDDLCFWFQIDNDFQYWAMGGRKKDAFKLTKGGKMGYLITLKPLSTGFLTLPTINIIPTTETLAKLDSSMIQNINITKAVQILVKPKSSRTFQLSDTVVPFVPKWLDEETVTNVGEAIEAT